MPERLVDVEKQGATVLHTFPVTISPPGPRGGIQAEGLGGGRPREVGPERGTRKSERQDACQPRRPTDPIRRSARRAGGDQGRSGRGRSRARLFALGAGGPAGQRRQTISGIERSISASANALTRCGSGRAVRKARRTSTGIGRAPLRRADASGVTKIRRAAPAYWLRTLDDVPIKL